MADSSPFLPYDQTYLVGVAVVACVPKAGSAPSSPAPGTVYSYRVRCLVTAYFTMGGSGVASVGAPTAGVPSAYTVGMNAGGIETIRSPFQYFIASVAAAFEVTPGEGL